MQLTNALNASVWPEMSRAHGAGELNTLRDLHRTNWGLTFWIVMASGCGLVALGPWIARHWLGAEAHFEWPLLMLLVLLATVSAVWNASSVVLAAINAHLHLGIRYVALQGLALAVAWSLTAPLGWYGLVGGLILAEALLLLWVTPQALATTRDNWQAFVQAATPGALLRTAGWRR
jgi:O-antigen/teichoic acid export membrane protein